MVVYEATSTSARSAISGRRDHASLSIGGWVPSGAAKVPNTPIKPTT
jgi:hypothetical protein